DSSRVAGLKRTNGCDVTIEPDPHVDSTVVAQTGDHLARPPREGRQKAGVEIQQSSIGSIRGFPVAHAAVSNGAFVAVDPELLAGGRVERDDRPAARQNVHPAVDPTRIEPNGPLA